MLRPVVIAHIFIVFHKFNETVGNIKLNWQIRESIRKNVDNNL